MAETTWIRKMENDLIKKIGQHALIGGPTGTGKTQILYFIADALSHFVPEETILWFDVGKSAEVLRLLKFKPIQFIIPLGCEIEIRWKNKKIEEKYKDRVFFVHYLDGDYRGMVKLFRRDCINIIEIIPFNYDPEIYTKKVSEFFRTLIKLMIKHRFDKFLPMTLFLDEIQWIAPGQGHALNEEHNTAGKWLQHNIDTLRSMGVRIVGAGQGMTKIRKGVRIAFGWIFIKRGLSFPATDEPKLSKFNPLFQTLDEPQTIIASPRRDFSEKLHLPFYGDGKRLGSVYYYDADEEEIDIDEEVLNEKLFPVYASSSSS